MRGVLKSKMGRNSVRPSNLARHAKRRSMPSLLLHRLDHCNHCPKLIPRRQLTRRLQFHPRNISIEKHRILAALGFEEFRELIEIRPLSCTSLVMAKSTRPSGRMPTPLRCNRLAEAGSNLGCIFPARSNSGPDWVAARGVGFDVSIFIRSHHVRPAWIDEENPGRLQDRSSLSVRSIQRPQLGTIRNRQPAGHSTLLEDSRIHHHVNL